MHDAEILSVSELELPADWKTKDTKYNCLEIRLDASGTRESNITKILLFNYKIKTPEVNINDLERPWWLRDRVTRLSNGRYELEMVIETSRGKHKEFTVVFETAEVERK